MSRVNWWSDNTVTRQPAEFTSNANPTAPVVAQSVQPVCQPIVIQPIVAPIQSLDKFLDGTYSFGADCAKPIFIDGTTGNPMDVLSGGANAPQGQTVPAEVAPVNGKGKKVKKANAKPILNFIFSLLFLAVVAVGYFNIEVIEGFLYLYGESTGIAVIMDFITSLTDGTFVFSFDFASIVVYLLLLAVVMDLLVLLISLFRFRKKTAIMTKIFAALQLVCVIAMGVLLMFFVTDAEGEAIIGIGIGTYILAGISLVSFLISVIGKR